MAENDQSTRLSSDQGMRGDDVAAIPLVEERVLVTKRQVASGRVRVHVNVEEREEIIAEQVCRDDVEVEHVAKNERITELPHVRLEGSTTIVPVVQEVLVVEKAFVLVEEIHIRRRTVSETVEIPVKVKSERARIERDSIPDDAAATRE